MSGRIRILLATVLAATSLAFVAVSPVVPSAAAAGCPSGQSQAWINLIGHLTWTTYMEVYDGGGYSHNEGVTTIYNNATAGKTTYTFCVAKDAYGTWRVKSVTNVVSYNYLEMDSNLHLTAAQGFMLGETKVNTSGTSFVVEPTICRSNDTSLEFFKFIIGLPIPGVHYAVSLGAWVLGQTLSSSTKCQAFADVTLPIYFNSLGGTTAGTNTSLYYESTPYRIGINCTGTSSCWRVNQYRWSITNQ